MLVAECGKREGIANSQASNIQSRFGAETDKLSTLDRDPHRLTMDPMATTSYDAKYANPRCRFRSLLISFNFLWLRRRRRILRPVELVEARGGGVRMPGMPRPGHARRSADGQTEGRKEACSGSKTSFGSGAIPLLSRSLRPSVIPPPVTLSPACSLSV